MREGDDAEIDGSPILTDFAASTFDLELAESHLRPRVNLPLVRHAEDRSASRFSQG